MDQATIFNPFLATLLLTLVVWVYMYVRRLSFIYSSGIPAAQVEALIMKPLILHASSKSSSDERRRVLHFVFGPRTLPLGLEWQLAI